MSFTFFFFNDTATTEIYTLSLHDALPIWFNDPAGIALMIGMIELATHDDASFAVVISEFAVEMGIGAVAGVLRSEEHTSELQSRQYLVCRLLLEKKKKRDSDVRTQKTLMN